MPEQAATCDECDSTAVVVTVNGLGACAEHVDDVMARVGALMRALQAMVPPTRHPSQNRSSHEDPHPPH
jgi:hypothetical protein